MGRAGQLMTGVDRRTFLKTVAAAGSGLAISRLAGARGTDPDVLIIGAGLAGLAAAFKLKLMGKRARIIERRSTPGGVCWTVASHGFRFPMGTAYATAPWRKSAAATIYKKLPQKWYRGVPEPFDSFYYRDSVEVDSTVFHTWWLLPGITPAQADDCQALSDWFTTHYQALNWPVYLNLDGDLKRYEDVTIRQMIQSFRPGCDRWVLGCLDSFVRATFNGNIDEVSGLQGLDMLGDEYSRTPGSNVVGASSYCMGDLVDALLGQVGADNVEYDAYVSSVKSTGSAVEVTYVSGGQTITETAKACVVATDALTAGTIVQDLPDKVKAAIQSIQYGEYAVVNLVMGDGTVPIHSFCCTLGDNPISTIYDFTYVQKTRTGLGLDGPPGIYGCYIPALSLNDHRPTGPEADLVKLCVDQLDDMFGAGTSQKVTEMSVCQYTHGMPVFRPGLTRVQQSALIPGFNERILLAGDYVQGSPTVEGALESGWYAGKAAGKLARAKS